MKNNTKIEERLENMKKFYLKAGEIIDNLPDTIPEDKREYIKKTILGDNDLKKLMDGIDSHRPPRILLIGRTGVGKSSLINALCGSYLAKVSDTKSCTSYAQIYDCKEQGRVLMQILDTRGIAESETLKENICAEDELLRDIGEFTPDVAIFMLNCTHRDDVQTDVEFLKKVSNQYSEINQLKLPIVVVVNKCDEMAPSRQKEPEKYPTSKVEKINEMVQYYKGIIIRSGLKTNNIIPVSSLVDWQTPDGMEISVEEIDNLPQYDIDNLQMAFDGRYRIDELYSILEEAIQDYEAQMGFKLAARLDEVVKRIANQLISIFSKLSAVVAITPIPVSDIYILILIQATLVALIATISGRDASLETAKEFIFSMAGIGGAGYAFKLLAQQASKLLNPIFPGTGSVISSTVAYAGTVSIGKSAISYYIDGKTLEEARQKMSDKNK